AAAVRGGADSDLDADLRLGDIVAGFASDGAERALEASGPCGGEELLGVGAVAHAVGFRAAELDVEDAVVADGVSLAAAGCCDGCRVTWFDLRHGSSCINRYLCRVGARAVPPVRIPGGQPVAGEVIMIMLVRFPTV